MPNLKFLNNQTPRGIAAPADVIAAPLNRACALSGLSRSGIYRAAAEGKIKLIKAGRTTLVDMASVRHFLADLPSAQIGTGKVT